MGAILSLIEIGRWVVNVGGASMLVNDEMGGWGGGGWERKRQRLAEVSEGGGG